MVIDFGDIKREVMIYDHKLLLPEHIVEVKMKNGVKYCHFTTTDFMEGYEKDYMIPRNDCVLMKVSAITSEAMCAAILNLFKLYENVNYAKVTVYETENSSATDEWKRAPMESDVEKIVQRKVEREQLLLTEMKPDPSVRTTLAKQ